MENDTLLVEFCSGERKEPVVLGETEELWKVSFGGSGVWVRKDDPCIIGVKNDRGVVYEEVQLGRESV